MGMAGRRWTWLIATIVLVMGLGFGSATATASDPAEIGAWTAPFEEGGAAQPRCVQDPNGVDGQMICKPTAVAAGVLPDGRVWYVDGLNGTESWRYTAGEFSYRARNSRSRVLDLRSGAPGWTIPTPEDGGGTNSTTDNEQNAFGQLGAPGRPGDGLTGSVWGALGLPPQDPDDPPDDVQDNDLEFFCSDQAQLPDGRLLIAGGTDWYNEPGFLDRDQGDPVDFGFPEIGGIRLSRVFNPATNSYTQVGDMKFGRWYPTVVTLPDGKASVFSGVTKVFKNAQLSQVRRTETFDSATGQWIENYTGPRSETSLPMVARMMLMPNGKILYSGSGQLWDPFGQAADQATWSLQKFWNPQTSEWESIGLAPFAPRSGAAQVLLRMQPPYDRATVMDIGGTVGLSTPGSYLGTPITTLTTVTADGRVSNSRTGDLHRGRWYSSAVTLPTGQVLAVSGGDRDGLILAGFELPVRQPELYDPETGIWTPMASARRDRTYHNSAVLLPDGRVLVGGHAPFPSGPVPFVSTPHDVVPGVTANNDRDPSFEVFSPPYLFRGARPAITAVQRGIGWGSSFAVASPDAAEITQVILSRLPSAQHTMDPDQRTLRLEFSSAGGAVNAVAPPSGVVAPPGYYYLFIIKDSPKGPIPSVARIVRLGETSDPTPTAAIYSSDDPPPPDTSIGATEPTDTSYLKSDPPPLPFAMLPLGLSGLGLRAGRRRLRRCGVRTAFRDALSR